MHATPQPEPGLVRRLGLGDAVLIGLGSMLGAGVFVAFGPAAAAAGTGLLLALGLAAAVGYANATSSARLAAVYPQAGGAYLYGRRRLGPGWGFAAGWAFVVGKTASCAAMALSFGVHVWPAHPGLPAVAAVAVLTAVNCLGVTRTAALNRVLVAATLLALAAVVVAGLGGGAVRAAHLTDPGAWTRGGPLGIARAAALLFFAFAGYARIATLGEEVRDPARTIPRAIPTALGLVLVIYATVGVTALLTLGPQRLAAAPVPLAAVAGSGDLAALTPAVRLGGALASLGVLLSLMAGIGRTTLAMARDRELPAALAVVHPRHRVPHRAELLLGAVVAAIVLLGDVRGAIAGSSFAVLGYYAVANASALDLARDATGEAGRAGRVLPVLGLAGCVGLAFTLPPATVAAGVVLVGAGPLLRASVRAARARFARSEARLEAPSGVRSGVRRGEALSRGPGSTSPGPTPPGDPGR